MEGEINVPPPLLIILELAVCISSRYSANIINTNWPIELLMISQLNRSRPVSWTASAWECRPHPLVLHHHHKRGVSPCCPTLCHGWWSLSARERRVIAKMNEREREREIRSLTELMYIWGAIFFILLKTQTHIHMYTDKFILFSLSLSLIHSLYSGYRVIKAQWISLTSSYAFTTGMSQAHNPQVLQRPCGYIGLCPATT